MYNLNNPSQRDFGLFATSESVNTGIVAASGGLFRFVTGFNGTYDAIETEIEQGAVIQFPLHKLNESKRYKFLILNPSRQQITDTDGNSVFQLTTCINSVQGVFNDNPTVPISDNPDYDEFVTEEELSDAMDDVLDHVNDLLDVNKTGIAFGDDAPITFGE